MVNGPQGLRAKFFNQIEGRWRFPTSRKRLAAASARRSRLSSRPRTRGLNQFQAELVNQLRRADLLNVRSSFEVNKPELRLSIDRDRAAALGVSLKIFPDIADIFGSLDLSRIKLDGKEYEVIAQLRRASRLTPQDLTASTFAIPEVN